MKHFLSLFSGLAIAFAATTSHAQIDWAAGAPGGTTGGSIRLGADQPPTDASGTGFSLATGIAAAQIAPTTGADYTIAAWIQSEQGATFAQNNRWWFGTGNQGLHLGVQSGNVATSGHWGNDSGGTTQIAVNTWVHVTHVYRGGFQEIYINGVLESSTSTGAPNNDSTDLQIGSRNGTEGPGWGGFLDDVAIFTSALSDPDIATLAADSSQAVALGAAAYYDFEDDQTGDTAANLVDVATSGLTGSDGVTPALQALTGIGDPPPPLPDVATWAAGAPGGTSGGSVEFDGTQFMQTGIASALVGGNRGNMGADALDYAVSAWIYSTADGDPDADPVVPADGDADSDHWWFGTGSQGVHFGVFTPTAGGVPTGTVSGLRHGHWGADGSGTTTVPANAWVHATFVFDADAGGVDVDGNTLGTMSVYRDGVLESTNTVAAANRSNTDLIIGARSGGREHWVGRVDDVAIFTNTISAADVTALFNDASQAPSLGAAAYYDFEDDQTGTTAANLVDVATSGLTGTSGDPALQALERITPGGAAPLKGDCNFSGTITFDDIPAFILILQGGQFVGEADCDCSGNVDFSDIPAFITILQSQ